MLERKRAHIQKVVSEAEMREFMQEMREEGEGIENANPNLVVMEEQQINKRMQSYMAPALGHVPEEGQEGCSRFMSTQVNGMSSKPVRRVKVQQLTQLINKYDVDMVGIGEPGINFANLPRSETLANFFDTEVELRSVSAFNVTENPPTDHQQGGASILVTNTLLPYAKKSGTDFRGLGRYCWYLLQGSKKHRTRHVHVYNVLGQWSDLEGSVIQQQIRYLQLHNIKKTPRELLRDDLLAQLHSWVKQGDRIILTMDANEHVLEGKDLCRELTDPDNGLKLKEISHTVWGKREPNTHISGKLPIDGVWVSEDLEVRGVKILTFGESVGDHRTIIFDITTRSLLGEHQHRIVRAGCRRLVTRNQGALSRYQSILEQQMIIHRMHERLDRLIAEVGEGPATEEQELKMEKLDRQRVELQKHAERRCRRILKPDLEFSLPVKLWDERMKAWKSLIRLKQGKAINASNVVRKAVKARIDNPRQLSLEQAQEGYAYARARKHQLRAQAPELRRDHLRNCHLAAKARKDEEAAKAVRQKIDREGNKKMWYFIRRAMNDPKGKPIVYPQKLDASGNVIEATDQDEAEQMIFEENEYRFQLATEAPISSTMLIEQLGYLADSDIAKQIIEGSFDIPDEVDDSTALILEEIGRIGVRLSNGEIDIEISPEEFRYFWRRVKENTASSISGIHFGHYKAAARSDSLSNFMSKQITLIARTGCPPDRWSHGLTVMLEKVAGLALVNRLRAILLMEADFNFHNRIIFGRRMLERARAEGLIPEEHFSEKDSTAEDGKFANVLASDIARQRRQPFCSLSADASNCYDRIHHAIMSLVFASMGIPGGAIRAMLQPIQLMKFFLRTGWGESRTHIGGDPLSILHGMCQGNAAAPASWLMLCSYIIEAYKSMGFAYEVDAPISEILVKMMGIVFVDDTDLLILKKHLVTIDKLWAEAQEALLAWGCLLISSGGALKPEKCHFYLMGFECRDGEWHCVDLESELDMEVPQPDGSMAAISQLPIRESRKTLGIFTNPAGACEKQVDVMQDKIQTWTFRLKNGNLPAKWAWVSYFNQLWPRLRYGLGVNASPLEEIVDLEERHGPDRPELPPEEAAAEKDQHRVRRSLRYVHHTMLSNLGVNQKIKFGWRHLHPSFGGIGLRKLAPEIVIARTNLFLQHYGAASSLGKSLSVTLEQLQLEAGTLGCPLQSKYAPFGPLTTPCWIRAFWEALDHYQFRLHIDYPSLKLPRKGDVLLIDVATGMNLGKSGLRSFHRCRLKWNLISLSDMASADGRRLEDHFLRPPTRLNRPSSNFDFPEERPTTEDWVQWAVIWGTYSGTGLTLSPPLGEWEHPTHRGWQWFYNPDHGLLTHVEASGTSIYRAAEGRYRTRGEQIYTMAPLPAPAAPLGHPCSVCRVSKERVILRSVGPDLAGDPRPADVFWKYLHSWGGGWMWEEVINEGCDLNWVVDSLRNGTAICVTDGSYNEALNPYACGAGWVIYCTKTKLRLRGSFFELSADADSYRAEALGLLALHTLLAAFQLFYEFTAASVKLCCDNESALYKSRERRRRIPTGASQADIWRALRNVKLLADTALTYEWVKGHADRYTRWELLSLEEQLNTLCDALAKSAVSRTAMQAQRRDLSRQTLPQERAAVFVGGRKQTSDVAEAMRLELGRVEAERFYVGELQWPRQTFQAVDWEARHSALVKKPQMYQLWLAKQSSGFCATQSMVTHWITERDDRCPNCGQRETAQHINVCPNRWRTKLLREQVAELKVWMADHHTHPDILYWVPQYIRLRNTRQLLSFPQLPRSLKAFGAEQDAIGWQDFMEGKISKSLLQLQKSHLANANTMMTGGLWAKEFISRVLHITHSQWLFRNVSLHDKTDGYLQANKRRELLMEIDRLMDTDPDSLPPDCQYLLEIDFNSLAASSAVKQTYWLYAIKAARQAGRRAVAPRRRRRSGAGARRLAARLGRRKRPALSLGTLEVERDIERTFGQRSRPTRKRPSQLSHHTQDKSNKRRKPD